MKSTEVKICRLHTAASKMHRTGVEKTLIKESLERKLDGRIVRNEFL
jgi:hypothetical protein